MSEKCRSCRAEIVWANHYNTGKAAPLERDERGAWSLLEPNGGELEYEPRRPFDTRVAYVNHFATCPQSQKWRGKR